MCSQLVERAVLGKEVIKPQYGLRPGGKTSTVISDLKDPGSGLGIG